MAVIGNYVHAMYVGLTANLHLSTGDKIQFISVLVL